MSDAPPESVETYDFSFMASRRREGGGSWFRFRLGHREWLCREMTGTAFVDSTGEILSIPNLHPSHLAIRARLAMNGETALLTPPGDLPEDSFEAVESLPASHYRMCARVGDEDWRLRDERLRKRRFVAGFRGLADLNWLDRGSHIFADNPVAIDTQGVAHFVTN